MAIKTLWKANSKRHKGSIAGIFVLLMLVSVSLCTVLAVSRNSGRYVDAEMERLGFGQITAWVSGISEADSLPEEIASVDGVDSVGVQSLIFSEYETHDQESDSEGQLIAYDPQKYPYKIFTDDLSGYREGTAEILPGEIYVPASLSSMFGVKIGDEIVFPIARSGVDKTFVVKGYFEDPFMGSSMIGMKGFLICGEDHEEIVSMITAEGRDSLARDGYMLHIYQSADNDLSAAQFNVLINENTGLGRYLEFTHSREAIAGFMLTLQNVFTALLLAFTAILILVALAVLGHTIESAIEQDYVNMGILKTMGFSSNQLRQVQLLQYLTGMAGGVAAGAILSIPAASFICRMTVTTTGLLMPSTLPVELCLPAVALIMLILSGFIWQGTGKIRRVAPMRAIQGDLKHFSTSDKAAVPIRGKGLGFWLALRQILTGRRRYAGACLTALLLVFFASLLGRVDAWLGPNGEGLMDAFNPAELHIAAQPMGETGIEDVESTIERYTSITDQYMLAMPSVSVNGVDYTSNVITEPERFQMLTGRTCVEPNEVVLTEFVAADMGVLVGDTVTIAGNLGSGEYTVSGIYQCANDMGANIGMNREGYGLIGEDRPQLWCVHYFLEDESLQPTIMQALEDTYGGDVYLHENSWPGLMGILSAMQLLMIFLYGIILFFVLVVTLLTTGKLLTMEERDLGVYKALGLSDRRLRRSFALRFGLTALPGSVLGTIFSSLLTDPLAAVLMRMEGISNFSSHPGLGTILLPGSVVTLLFLAFAWLAAERIRKIPLSVLIAER